MKRPHEGDVQFVDFGSRDSGANLVDAAGKTEKVFGGLGEEPLVGKLDALVAAR